MKTKKIAVVLDNIRSVHNVGSIFRTSDCAGVSKIYLCGTTPSPVDRFGRERKDFSKVALGADKSVFWKYFERTKDAVSKLKEEGYKIVSVEQDKNSIDYRKLKNDKDIAIVFGAEVLGVSKEILNVSDQIVEIPMKGEKESLNVSVTAGVILFTISL